MIELNAGNVLLKPSHRKQLLAWLRRSIKLGERLGQFVLSVTLHRAGRMFHVTAEVKDSAGNFRCRSRSHDWRTATRDLVRSLVVQLHSQQLARVSV